MDHMEVMATVLSRVLDHMEVINHHRLLNQLSMRFIFSGAD